MTHFTIEIAASNEDGSIWQALAPAETFNTANWTAEEVARAVAFNQTLADGSGWRVRVWHGADADTGVDPAAELHASDL